MVVPPEDSARSAVLDDLEVGDASEGAFTSIGRWGESLGCSRAAIPFLFVPGSSTRNQCSKCYV